jgi:hypothetical protein
MSQLPLGKAPARPGAVKLQFGDYVNTSVLAAPPESFGHDQLVGAWPMLANDQVGDCAIADALHQHQLWNNEHGIAIPLNDTCAIQNYSVVTGYDGTPDTDQGTDVPELIKFRMNTGLIDAANNVHKIGAAVALEPGNWEQLIYAMYYFDGVTLGVTMCQQWMTAFQKGGDSLVVWEAVKTPKAIGGHAITGVAFHDNLARPISWGSDNIGLTEQGYAQASDETYAFFSAERIANGVDINGIDAEKLQADLPLLQDVA